MVKFAATSSDRAARPAVHSATYLKRALMTLREEADWKDVERLIVVTDEQSHDGILPVWTRKAYVINVAPYKSGISLGNGWMHIDGWSERVLDYIAAIEGENAR